MKFRRVYIEITGFCGLECDFCPPKPRQKVKIPLDLFRNIASQLSTIAREVSLHVLGDPLSLQNLSEYLDVLYVAKLKAHVTTTGFYLPRHTGLLLSHKAIKQINFSLNGFSGIKSGMDLSHYLSSIFDFCDKATSLGDRFVNLRLWNGKGNFLDDEFSASIKKAIVEHFGVEVDFENQKRTRLDNKVIFDFDDYFDWPSASGDIQKDSYCLGLIDQFGILSDGRAVPCCLDYNGEISLGNAFESNITTILSSNRAQNIINGFRRGEAVEELCRRCSYRLRFS